MSVFPSQAGAVWWYSPIRESPLTFNEQNNPETTLVDLDASAWADAHNSQNRGHHRQVGGGSTTNTDEHPFMAEARQAAQQQKEDTIPDWLEEPEQKRKELEERGFLASAQEAILRTCVRFLSQLYSRQLRVSRILIWRYSDTPGP